MNKQTYARIIAAIVAAGIVALLVGVAPFTGAPGAATAAPCGDSPGICP
jgi:hypothetical protein